MSMTPLASKLIKVQRKQLVIWAVFPGPILYEIKNLYILEDRMILI